MKGKQDQNCKRKQGSNLEEESNLLDSINKQNNNGRASESHSQESSEEGYLNKVENILNENPRKKMSSQQIMLQAQVMELQMKCNSLTITNQRLIEKLNQALENDEDKKKVKSKEQTELSSTSDISQVQIQLTELQEYLFSFKSQFQQYQNRVNGQLKNNDERVVELQKQIEKLNYQKGQLQRNIKQEKENTYTLIRRNEELLMELQDERQKKIVVDTMNRGGDYGYGNQFQYELQNIIQKLADELKYERSLKKKYHSQIKDLTRELSDSEKVIQKKNQSIYNLQLKLLIQEKKNFSEERFLK